MRNILLTAISSILLLVGLISMLTPIPGGIFLVAGSLTTLICTSPTARLCLQSLRSRTGWVDKVFLWLEKKIGQRIEFVGDALRRTRPGNSEDKLERE